ncbi:hypothetical protein K439DRAFT_1658081 [Ramaria rubella]|nr:hypothetical protein K439DRAFT_1658081 [Ramaria rubella]
MASISVLVAHPSMLERVHGRHVQERQYHTGLQPAHSADQTRPREAQGLSGPEETRGTDVNGTFGRRPHLTSIFLAVQCMPASTKACHNSKCVIVFASCTFKKAVCAAGIVCTPLNLGHSDDRHGPTGRFVDGDESLAIPAFTTTLLASGGFVFLCVSSVS